jgi:hypothetical protein
MIIKLEVMLLVESGSSFRNRCQMILNPKLDSAVLGVNPLLCETQRMAYYPTNVPECIKKIDTRRRLKVQSALLCAFESYLRKHNKINNLYRFSSLLRAIFFVIDPCFGQHFYKHLKLVNSNQQI